MKRRHNIGMTLILLALATIFVAQEAMALPAFARKYQTSCITCHSAFPRLNSVGEAFRLDGYKFMDDELYIKEEPVEMGDEAYKKLWPKRAIWPTDIPGFAPISLKLTSDFRIDTGGTKDARTNFAFPSEGKLIGAGTFGEHISFFTELVFSQGSDGDGHGHGGDAEEGSLATSLEGWLQFEDLFGIRNAFNLRVGTVGMQEFGLFTARDHNRLTLNPYLYTTYSTLSFDEHLVESILGDSDVAANMFTIHAQPGIELNGFGRRWRYALGVVNGNGSVSDNNSEKDVYLQLAYKFYGRTFDGSTREGESALGSGDPWRDDSITVSFFGHRGTGNVRIGGIEEQDDFWRLGPGIQWKYRDLTMGAGYFWGHNDNPYGALADRSVDSQSWFVEAHYFVLPWMIPSLRYEGVSLDLASGMPSMFVQENQDRQRIIASVKMLLRANVSLTVEGRYYIKDERSTGAFDSGGRNDDSQVAMSLSYAF